jgi:predicted nucleic acid-binding protein
MTLAWKHSAARVIVDERLGRRVAEYLVLEATPSA